MKKVYLLFAMFLLLLVQSANALVILTDKAIDLGKKQGMLKGKVVFNNKVYPAIALGTYKLSTNRKSIVFSIDRIKNKEQIHNLNSAPSVIKETKEAKKLSKGSKLILAGENQEEIANILGIPTKDYKKGSGTSTVQSSSGSSGDSASSNGNISSSGTSGTSGSSTFSSSGSDYGNYGSGYYPNAPDSNNGLNGNYLPLYGNGNDNSDNSKNNTNGGSEYSTEYCKTPQRNGNSMNLSVIDKDGSCMDIEANRDDTKCEYRYDFNNGIAIKQTQFYYVDKQNAIKNIGGCVDLEGKENQFPLYKDDSKCKLEVTSNKGYGGNQAYMFQTQILFRGSDGLIHMAQDCSDYQNVEEELINYDKDIKSKKLKRIVNQYYTDPTTGKKVYINNGIISPFTFAYQEYQCGKWEFDDSNLQAYGKTQIKAWDNISNKYVEITGCDYSNDQGKAGRITMPYTQLPDQNKDGEAEPGDMNGTYDFEIKQGYWYTFNQSFKLNEWHSYTRYGTTRSKITKWKTTYKTTNVGVTTGYQRPKQPDEIEPSIYYKSKRIKTITRSSSIIQNDLKLDDDYLKFYESKEEFYKDSKYLESDQFKEYVTKYYEPGFGYCDKWSLYQKDFGTDSGAECRKENRHSFILPSPPNNNQEP